MQMYRGLPIITNQISPEEQRGVPHHLLAMVDHHEPTWTVQNFAAEARKVVQGIRSRGKLPIVVGGTHYYINSLLFEDSVVRARQIGDDDDATWKGEEETSAEFPILDAPTDVMLDRLREVDPVMGARWHPTERRRIRRSLEIYLTTGKRASDIYAEQQVNRLSSKDVGGPWEALMFWVYSKPDVLHDRLNRRVDKMLDRGLMAEVRALHEEAGESVDRSKGVWQSIGFKQLEPFLKAEGDDNSPSEIVEKLKNTGMEEMRIATRQYARAQLKWIRGKTVPALKEHDALRFLYLLDSSDAENFTADVLQPAAAVCRQFLRGEDMAKPRELSDTAREVLGPFEDSAPRPVLRHKTCDACHMTVLESEWGKHVNGRRHRRILKHKSRTALVLVEDAEAGVQGAEGGTYYDHVTIKSNSKPPSVDLGGLP